MAEEEEPFTERRDPRLLGREHELELLVEIGGQGLLSSRACLSVPVTSTTKSSAYRMGRNTARPALRS